MGFAAPPTRFPKWISLQGEDARGNCVVTIVQAKSWDTLYTKIIPNSTSFFDFLIIMSFFVGCIRAVRDGTKENKKQFSRRPNVIIMYFFFGCMSYSVL
jgi:hypothetical protein